MNIDDTREKILHNDAFVLSEVKKLQYFYGLKYEIRYDQDRGEHVYSESVAEHVYAMNLLADYFLALEDTQLDSNQIRQTITWHDMDELKTGDIISWKKTPEQVAHEQEAWQAVVPELPDILQNQVSTLVADYEQQRTAEGKFVKAIDKIEPLFHLYNAAGKTWCTDQKLTRHDSERIKYPYIAFSPYIERFCTVIHDAMEQEGFFRN